MRNAVWPISAKWSGELPTIEAHSRGGRGAFGESSYGIAGGARVVWTINVVPLITADALEFRAFLHSLRASSGTFRITMPAPRVAGGTYSSPDGYSDDTLHSDDTAFSDTLDTSVSPLLAGVTNGTSAAGTTTLLVDGFTPITGAWMTVLTSVGQQLVRVVSSSVGTIGIRPALRGSVSIGAPVHHGPVTATMRLIGNPPAVPLIVLRSKGVTLECEEAY